MIDISTHTECFKKIKYLNIRYRYKLLDYLVADKYGNLFILPHCPNKRTIEFKKLRVFKNGKYRSIKYHQVNKSFKTLKKLSYIVKEKYYINELNNI